MKFKIFGVLKTLIRFFKIVLLSNFLTGHCNGGHIFVIYLSLATVFATLFCFPKGTSIRAVFMLGFLGDLTCTPAMPLL